MIFKYKKIYKKKTATSVFEIDLFTHNVSQIKHLQLSLLLKKIGTVITK